MKPKPSIAVKQQLRIVPIQFTSVATNTFKPELVSVEQSGFSHRLPFFSNSNVDTSGCNVISMASESEISINVHRANIDTTTPLFVSASNEELLTVISPNEEQPLVNGLDHKVTVKACPVGGEECGEERGELTENVFLEIRIGAIDGPIMAKLAIVIMPIMQVNIQAYVVNVISDKNSATAPVVSPYNYKSVIEQTKAIWFQYGIDLRFAAPQELNIKLAKHQCVDIAEINLVLNSHYTENHINLYFVPQLSNTQEPALVFSPAEYTGYCVDEHTPLSHPALFITTNTQANSSISARLLAQKLGQFMGLESISANLEKDSRWLKANLMYELEIPNKPQSADTLTQPYITLKHIETKMSPGPNLQNSEHPHSEHQHPELPLQSQCLAIRNHVAKGPKALYS